MPYNAARHYDAVPDGNGGVRMMPKPALARSLSRYKFRDGMGTSADPSLPARKDPFKAMTEGKDAARVVANLDPPPEGMVYRVEQSEDGTWSVILDGDTGEDLTTVDRTTLHKLYGRDATIDRMNRVHRRFWSRDRYRARDAAELRRVLFHHTPLPSERVELKRNDDGSCDVVLVSEATNLIGDIPPGASGDKFGDPSPPDPNGLAPAESWISAPGEGERGTKELTPRTTAYSRDSAPAKLAQMNAANRAFWARKR